MDLMMSRDEYREALQTLGLTQVEVGRLMHVGARTARRWASGETPVPGPIEIHIRLWLQRN
jgi:DNA-binding transcriptional regulator YiaG